MILASDVQAMLMDAASEFGKTFQADTSKVATYTVARAAVLAQAVGKVGFERAVRAERDNVALMLGIQAVKNGDDFDQRMLGIITGVLGVGARVLTGGTP